MKFFNVIAIVISIVTMSCTLDKTDYEAEINTIVTEYYEFEEAASLTSGNYKISIEALNGTFYKGYNELHLKVIDTQTNQNINDSEVTFLPIMVDSDNNVTSCPHLYTMIYDAVNGYYSGYSVFTHTSSSVENHELYISFTVNNQSYSVHGEISVQEQTNKNLNMTSFTGNDGEEYYIALISPQKPNVAENELIAGIYKYNQPVNPSGNFPDPAQFSYSTVDGYTLLLDPRMPEPSMGNHSSPNNQDLTQQSNGLYYGVVNYTMTGNWALNFIMLDQNDQVVKGTEVPTDFTPGIEGVKSELYIDILF